jgi:hypothetical protein
VVDGEGVEGDEILLGPLEQGRDLPQRPSQPLERIADQLPRLITTRTRPLALWIRNSIVETRVTVGRPRQGENKGEAGSEGNGADALLRMSEKGEG